MAKAAAAFTQFMLNWTLVSNDFTKSILFFYFLPHNQCILLRRNKKTTSQTKSRSIHQNVECVYLACKKKNNLKSFTKYSRLGRATIFGRMNASNPWKQKQWYALNGSYTQTVCVVLRNGLFSSRVHKGNTHIACSYKYIYKNQSLYS